MKFAKKIKAHYQVTAGKKVEPIPADWPVQPLKPGEKAEDKATCGHCGLSWDDGISTSMTPAPSARCPFEQFHIHDEEENTLTLSIKVTYDLNGVPLGTMKKYLERLAENAAGDGSFTGDTEAEVDDWSYKIT
jgi:hypothetical protein